jgi:hypothetical protein
VSSSSVKLFRRDCLVETFDDGRKKVRARHRMQSTS